MQQVLNGTTVPPEVVLGNVRVTGIIRLPTDLTDDLDAPSRRDYVGQGDIIATAAFYRAHAGHGRAASPGYRSSSRGARRAWRRSRPR